MSDHHSISNDSGVRGSVPRDASPDHRSASRDRSRSRDRYYRRGSRHSRSRSYSPHRSRKRYSRSRSRSYSPYDRDRYGYRRSRSRSPMSSRKRHIAPRDEPPPSRCIGVFGLSLYSDEKTLIQYFSQYGKVENCQVVYDKKSGRSRGFGFVYFENVEDAIVAKERAPGSEIDGHRVRCDFSITKRPHTPTPGIYMGRPTRRNTRDDYYMRGRSPSPYYSRRRSRSYSFSPRR